MSLLGGGNSNIFLSSSWTLGFHDPNLTCTHIFQMGWWKTTNLRLFQHTFGTHPEQPLPIGCKSGILFIVGARGFAERVCWIGCVVKIPGVVLTHPTTRWPWGFYICFPRFFARAEVCEKYQEKPQEMPWIEIWIDGAFHARENPLGIWGKVSLEIDILWWMVQKSESTTWDGV